MNTGQSSQTKVKRSIRVKDFLDDFNSGVTDEGLMEKYHLTPVGLEKFYTMLIDRGIIDADEFAARYEEEDPEPEEIMAESGEAYVCPTCMAAFAEAPGRCPECDTAIFAEQDEDTDIHAEAPSGEWEASPVPSNSVPGGSLSSGPIELPLEDMPGLSEREDRASSSDPFSDDEFDSLHKAFEDNGDNVVSGMPLDYHADGAGEGSNAMAVCTQCQETMFPAVRKIYDRAGALLTMAVAGVLLLLGAVGAAVVTVLQSYSVARVVMIYFTGISMLSGAVFLALGVFMLFLAKERIFFCHDCGRILPRA